MKLIRVTYPFEADLERGASDWYYPSLKVARIHALDMYEGEFDDEENERTHQSHSRTPAVVEEVALVDLTKSNLCGILNENGPVYRSCIPIGQFVYKNHKLKYCRYSRRELSSNMVSINYVLCRSGLRGWQACLQKVYSSYQEFVAYADMYDIHQRLGYDSPQQAWSDNPIVQGSANPDDLCKIVDGKRVFSEGDK